MNQLIDFNMWEHKCMVLFQIFRPADLIRRFTDSSRVDQKKSGTIAANNLVNSGYQFSDRDGDTEVGRDGQVLGKPGKAWKGRDLSVFSVHRNYKREDTKNARCSP